MEWKDLLSFAQLGAALGFGLSFFRLSYERKVKIYNSRLESVEVKVRSPQTTTMRICRDRYLNLRSEFQLIVTKWAISNMIAQMFAFLMGVINSAIMVCLLLNGSKEVGDTIFWVVISLCFISYVMLLLSSEGYMFWTCLYLR